MRGAKRSNGLNLLNRAGCAEGFCLYVETPTRRIFYYHRIKNLSDITRNYLIYYVAYYLRLRKAGDELKVKRAGAIDPH
jgi:hypothetical protein